MKSPGPLCEPQATVVTEHPNRRFYHSEQCLLDDGWTKYAIAKFLPAVPDLVGPAPFGEPGDPPIRWWLRRRVSESRRTSDYQKWKLRECARRAHAIEREAEEARKRRNKERGWPDLW